MAMMHKARPDHHIVSRGSLKVFRLGILAFAIAMPASSPVFARENHWVGTWMASPQPIWGSDFAFPTKIPLKLENQTIRQIVRVSLGGQRFRVVFSNEYGDRPLVIGDAHVALTANSSVILAATDRKLTFGGKDQISVPPGAPVVSDPVELPVRQFGRLSISLFLPNATPLTTFHWDGKQTAYIGDGNLSATEVFPAAETTDARVFLSGILVDAPSNDGAVMVIGDSITDGNGASLDADSRWPDFLAKRLAGRNVAVLNAGISGARLLNDKMGVNASARFTRDVLAKPKVKAVILLMGINDISWPGTAFAPNLPLPAVETLISGYRQIIAQAHAHNLRIIGATLTPFEGALSGTPFNSYYNRNKDALRQQVNAWIRTSGAFDAVVDFDALLRDPAHPARLLADFDSGDHLHPGDKGNRAMADAVDLDVLLRD
jgi:lysophospholipase L1-like esterase